MLWLTLAKVISLQVFFRQLKERLWRFVNEQKGYKFHILSAFLSIFNFFFHYILSDDN